MAGWLQSAPRASQAVATLLLVQTDHVHVFCNACSLQQFITLCVNPLDKKKKKEEIKIPVRDVKEKSGDEEKKKEKPKAHAPSHAKIRSIGNFSLMSSYIFPEY